MKKYFVILVLVFVIFIIGCAQQQETTTEKPTTSEPPEVETTEPTITEPSEIQQPTVQEKEEAPSEEEETREKCSRTFSQKFSAGPYYNGPLFDAHFHMPTTFDLRQITEEQGHEPSPTNYVDPILGKDVTLDEILCFFDKEDVRGNIGFYIPNFIQLDASLEAAKNIKRQSANRINLFLMPAGLEIKTLESVQNSNQGLFEGYGELAFYDPRNLPPNDKTWLDVYALAGKHGLIVMMHPGLNQKSQIEKVLQLNPKVDFLLHGFQIENSITDLMDRYPNVYFSIDSAVLYPMMGLFISGPKEEFVSKFKQDFDSMLNQRINKWKKEIEKHPDRFVWGTDRGPKWHFDEEISVLFEEFARAFIGRLDPTVQEKYAYRNAERLLQG